MTDNAHRHLYPTILARRSRAEYGHSKKLAISRESWVYRFRNPERIRVLGQLLPTFLSTLLATRHAWGEDQALVYSKSREQIIAEETEKAEEKKKSPKPGDMIPVVFSLRSMPAVAFLPVGGKTFGNGERLNDSGQAGLFAIGASSDLVNYWVGTTRVSIASVSAYLLGLNFAGFSEKTRWLNLAYARIGPHITFAGHPPVDGMGGRSGLVGFQIGYGAILTGDTFQAQTTILHGIDLALTLTWTSSDDDIHGAKTDRSAAASPTMF